MSWDDPRPHACRDGCQLAQAQNTLAQAQTLIAQAEQMRGRTINGEITMSQALWCDAGEHAFSARDPKREHWQRTVWDGDDRQVEIPWDVCSQHVQQPAQTAVTDGRP